MPYVTGKSFAWYNYTATNVFYCPGMVDSPNSKTTYGQNWYLNNKKMNWAKRPTKRLMFVDNVISRNWASSKVDVEFFFHKGSANILFMDGHVDTRKESEAWPNLAGPDGLWRETY